MIDCQTGIVLHKYKAPREEFFSVAWTTLTVVTQAGHKKRWNVLAAAGLRGQVRLLHVRAGFCCGVIRAHKKAIATLCFSPTHETHLFSKTLPTLELPCNPALLPDRAVSFPWDDSGLR